MEQVTCIKHHVQCGKRECSNYSWGETYWLEHSGKHPRSLRSSSHPLAPQNKYIFSPSLNSCTSDLQSSEVCCSLAFRPYAAHSAWWPPPTVACSSLFAIHLQLACSFHDASLIHCIPLPDCPHLCLPAAYLQFSFLMWP